MYDFPVHVWWSWVHDCPRDQNGSPYFSSIVRQCKWPSLSREIVEIQKICFNGKVKSHFSFLLRDKETGEKRKETARGMVRRGNEGTIHLHIYPRALVFLNGFLRLLVCLEKIPLFPHLNITVILSITLKKGSKRRWAFICSLEQVRLSKLLLYY